MKKKIFQIAVGPIPERIQVSLDSWKQYAQEHDIDYELITEFPPEYSELNCDNRCKSNWLRVDLLINSPHTWYVDWDTQPLGEIPFPDHPVFVPYMDNCLYLGNDLEFAKRLRAKMGDMQSRCRIVPVIFEAFRKIFMEDFKLSGETNYKVWLLEKSKYKDWFLPAGIIEHLNFSRRTK
jgi:hypothetical protein